MANLDDLVVPQTKEEIEETMLGLAEAEGLPVTSWGASSFFRLLFSIFATLLSQVWFSIAQTSRGVLLSLSQGAWLTLLARSQFDEERYIHLHPGAHPRMCAWLL